MPDCTCAVGLSFDCPAHGLGNKEAMLKTKVASKGRINKASWDEVYRSGLLAGVKRERIRLLGPQCEWCGRVFPSVRGALEGLHLHHHEQRSLGQRATPDSIEDVDRGDNLMLVCGQRDGCHRLLENDEPRWSEVTA
jgi:5-methylcytosine-specific restriction endonuclease McrA